jgi:hypothetical protein
MPYGICKKDNYPQLCQSYNAHFNISDAGIRMDWFLRSYNQTQKNTIWYNLQHGQKEKG